jgi:hypothetical protein
MMTTDASAANNSAKALDPDRWVAGRDAWNPNMWTQLRLAILGRRFAAKYFAQLDIEYDGLCPPEYKRQTHALVSSFREENAKLPNWVLNHRYEYTLLAGLSPEILRQRVALYRERLVALVGASDTGFLKAAFPPVESNAQAERQSALGLLSEVQRFRHLRTEFDRLRNRLLLWVLLLAAPFAWIFAIVALRAPSAQSEPLLGVAVAGLFGGYFSVLLRVGALRWHPDYAVNYQQVDKLFWNLAGTCCLSMFEGAVAALILYSIFGSGLVRGDLFPSIYGGHPGTAGAATKAMETLGRVTQAASTTIDTTTEGANTGTGAVGRLWNHFHGEPKLIVWSVIAGFSERLVPDFLSALQQERSKASNTLSHHTPLPALVPGPPLPPASAPPER